MCLCFAKKKELDGIILEQIYLKTKEYPVTELESFKPEQAGQLKDFVKPKAKALIDYLQNNPRRLRGIGKNLRMKLESSSNLVDHLLILFILNEVLPALKNLSYDRSEILKMIREEGKSSGKVENMQIKLNKHREDNYLYFEGKITEIFEQLLEQKSNQGDFLFPFIIETLAVYGNSIPKLEKAFGLKTDKQQVIIKILEKKEIAELQGLEVISTQSRIVEGLSGITSNSDRKLSPVVKEQTLNYLYRILTKCEASISTGNARSSGMEKEVKELSDLSLKSVMNIVDIDFKFYDVEFYHSVRIYYISVVREVQPR